MRIKDFDIVVRTKIEFGCQKCHKWCVIELPDDEPVRTKDVKQLLANNHSKYFECKER